MHEFGIGTTDLPLRPLFSRNGVESGHHRLIVSISALDPNGHWPRVSIVRQIDCGQKTFSAVAALGAPSLNSSVPMRVSILSGVVIAGRDSGSCLGGSHVGP